MEYQESISRKIAKEFVPETEHNPQTGNFKKPGKLELIESDAQWLQEERTVSLQQGINTLGRKSPDSAATLLLPTTDTFMSRTHAMIEVKKKADGVFEHRLSDLGSSKNGTCHNGERIETGDVIILMPNDIFKIGHTLFKIIEE